MGSCYRKKRTTNMNKSAKSPVNDVSERLRNTRKEVETIKAEIEKLISAGVGPAKIPTLPLQQQFEKNDGKDTNKKDLNIETNCSKKPNAQQKVPIKIQQQQQQQQQKTPQAPKTKPYNVAETREYIKKQHEKRVQEIKQQIVKTDNQIDLRKQKLKALQEKTRELVTKNVQMKRERSKSRDRNNEIRIDHTKQPSSIRNRDRSKSRERLNGDQQKKQQNLVKEQQHKDGLVCSRLSRSTVSKTDLNRPEKLFKNVTIRKNRLVNNNNNNRIESTNLENNNIVDRVVLDNAIMTDDCEKDTKETQTSLKSNINNDNSLPSLLLIPPQQQQQQQNPPTDPYNFINTVKRKLQFVVNDGNRFCDIGIQNSLPSSIDDNRQKLKDEIPVLLDKNSAKLDNGIDDDEQSFISHHHYQQQQQPNSNLNLEIVEKLKLIPTTSNNRNVSQKLLFNDNNDDDGDDSGSDTSKNIPEICSESGVSSSRSTVINSERNLDLERLNKLKLQTSTKNDKQNSEIITNNNTQNYSLDFIDEPEDHSNSNISTILNKSIYTVGTNGTPVDILPSNQSKHIEKSMYLQIPSMNLDVNISKNRGDDDVRSSFSFQNDPTDNSMNSSSILEDKSILSNSIKTTKPSTITIQTNQDDNTNRIHLKFEAEVHLLNDFNKSFHQFLELEEAFQHLKRENNDKKIIDTKILQNNDTQTSFKTVTTTTTERNRELSINFTRGSDIIDDNFSINNKSITALPQLEFSSFSDTNNGQSTINHEDNSRLKSLISYDYDANNCAGLSLNMFEQLIRDEDARLKHLKAIIKIREQALLDRTKGELVWLEIQKKHLIETGKLEEASLIKKKQRGILLKLEQERNEIKRLKQTQKQASNERINKLKHQRNLIKSQLSTNEMLTNIKITTPASLSSRKNRRQSGPLIVKQNRKETISTRRSCSGDDILSITTTSRISCGVSSTIESDDNSLNLQQQQQQQQQQDEKDEEEEAETETKSTTTTSLHRNLSMREKALRERKKTAEELLKWHQKLLDEEKKITALEIAANILVKQIPKTKKKQQKKNNNQLMIIDNGGKQQQQQQQQEIFEFNGKQLNQLWINMTGRIEKKYRDDKEYIMSQTELERFCKSAVTQQNNKKKLNKNSEFLKTLNLSITTTTTSELSDDVCDIPEISGKTTQVTENIKTTSEEEEADNIKTVNGEYSSEFESESVHEIINIDDNNDDEIDKNQITSISELIHNFSRIGDEISVLGKNQEKNDETTINSVEATQQNNSILDILTEITDQINVEQQVKQETIIEDVISNNQKTESEQIEDIIEYDSNSCKETEDNKSIIESTEISENVKNSITDNILKIEDSIKEIDEKFDQSLKILTTKSDDLISETNLEHSTTVNSEIDIFKTSITVQDTQTNQNDESTHGFSQSNNSNSNSIETVNNEKTSKIDELLTENADIVDDDSATLNHLISNEVLSEEQVKHDYSTEESQLITMKESEQQYSDDFKSEITENEQTTIGEDSTNSKKTSTSSTTTTTHQIDVKKRVSEIMADATGTLRSDKSPRLQDIYVTTYDNELLAYPADVKTEAEELLRKRIAIEQEIKQIEQQQKEQIPYMYVREIPNKPPPPYTPPSTLPVVQSILPSDPKEIDEITSYTSKVLYKAYESNNLENVKFFENNFKLTTKFDIGKNCCELLFNICKELTNEHYKQFNKIENEPTWLKIFNKKQQLSLIKPYNCKNLERFLNCKLKELFGFQKPHIQESMIIKWGRKKRDHVDEILIKESQDEDSQWTNFDKDELIVKDQLTDFIMDMLIDETVDVVQRIVSKKIPMNCNKELLLLDEVKSDETN